MSDTSNEPSEPSTSSSGFEAAKQKKITHYCCVPQCETRAGPSVHFHHFPKNEKMREKWTVALKMGKKVNDADRVCHEHFLPSDYIPQAVPTRKRFLKKTTIPTQNLPTRSHDRVDSPAEEMMKENRKKRAEKRSTAVLFQRVSDEEEEEGMTVTEEAMSEDDRNEELGITDAEGILRESGSPERATVPAAFRESATQTDRFSILTLLTDSSKLYTYTGLTNATALETISECAARIAPESARFLLPVKFRVALCLTKLKLNLSHAALAVLFGISRKTCSNYFRDTVRVLAQVLKGLVYLPSKEETLQNMPKCFRLFHNTRIVLDCAEVPLEKQQCLRERIMTWSHYKGRHTLKFCVGVSPAGLIIFVSKVYGGRASDKKIVIDSGILDKLNPNDGVMVDKGFMIESECVDRRLQLIRPPFLAKKKALSKEEAIRTAQIARARVHVERVIKKLRDFNILKDQVSTSFLPYIDDILTICAALVNLSTPVLGKDKF